MSNKSPFPGMDPWLEDHWGDVHTRLTMYASDRLQLRLPAGLRTSVEEYVTIESRIDSERHKYRFAPDILVSTKRPNELQANTDSASTLVATGPIHLPRLLEPPVQRRIQIVDSANKRIVTSIEFLSPANKMGRGLEQFCKKQQDFLDCGVNLVEIDLVRGGHWAISIFPELVPDSVQSVYRALVVRASRQEDGEFYPISLETPLPNVKVPLRPNESDVLLELQPVLELAYANGRYSDVINYRQPPGNPLPQPLAEWTTAWLEQHSS